MVVGWAIATLVSIGGVGALVSAVTFPRAIAEHPMRTRASVTSVFINGLGGDPAVDYRYEVNGRTYRGWGTGELGQEPLLDLQPGDHVAIEYSSRSPGISCTCDAKHDAPTAFGIVFDAACALLLPGLVLRRRRRRRAQLTARSS